MQYINKDITTVAHGFIVHQVNCHKVMNSGVARAIRHRWPKVFTEYVQYCESNKTLLGTNNWVHISPELTVINAFGQNEYGYNGSMFTNIEALDACLYEVFSIAAIQGDQVYLPRIGCGLGGADWKRDVEPIILKYEQMFEGLQIIICDYP